MILEFKNVSKTFGQHKVLDNISFTAKSGVANGYLGRNGSGKTTTFRLLLDIFRPDSGQILLDGKPIDRSTLKIGYLPEERGMYDGVGLVDQLVYFGKLKGMSTKDAKASAQKWLEFFELKDNKKALKTLSKGNAQKIQIIQCVIDDPDILVLDEPFSGLDPVNVGKLKEIINDFIARDKLVIFSSHQMPVVETFCQDINLLEKGNIILSGNIENIKKELGGGKMLLKLDGLTSSQLHESLTGTVINADFTIVGDDVMIDFKDDNARREIMNYIIDFGFNIEDYKLYKPSLEEIFVERVGGKDE